MNLTEFHIWLARETPARADELTARLDVFHRMLPKSYAGWPKGAVEVSEALRALEVKGLARKIGTTWEWVSAAKVEPQRELFA